jgi:hypothetical protein
MSAAASSKGSRQPAATQQYHDTQNDAGERSQPARDAHPRIDAAHRGIRAESGTLGDEKDAAQHIEQTAENAEDAADDLLVHDGVFPLTTMARRRDCSAIAAAAR